MIVLKDVLFLFGLLAVDVLIAMVVFYLIFRYLTDEALCLKERVDNLDVNTTDFEKK